MEIIPKGVPKSLSLELLHFTPSFRQRIAALLQFYPKPDRLKLEEE